MVVLTRGNSGVAVLGGVNRDTIIRVVRLPRQGETVIGLGLEKTLGGKAANQAVAAARAGVPVSLLAAVGADGAGDRCLEMLSGAGVDVSAVVRLAGVPTGEASIWVDENGQNSIVVTPAANRYLRTRDVIEFENVVAQSDILVVQGEIHSEVSIAGIRLAERHGTRVVLNLAPFADDFDEDIVALANPLVVNEVEAAQLLGIDEVTDLEAVVSKLSSRARSVVITLGAAGAIAVRGDAAHRVLTPLVEAVVDTTGAGDAFVGVLAAGLLKGLDLVDATTRAVAAATASTQVYGAGDRYPRFDLETPQTARA